MKNKYKRNLTIFGMLFILLLVIGLTFGNVIEESFSGSGNIDTRHYLGESSDEASANDATGIAYSMSASWEEDEFDKNLKLESSFIVSVPTNNNKGGTYFNRYVVKSYGADYKHVYRVYYEGDFSGSASVMVSLDKTTGSESIDSLFLMDSRNGNASFQGRIYNSDGGKPLTVAQSDLYGKLIVRSYLNITDIPETEEDFCSSLNRDVIADGSAGAIYILPKNNTKYNYTLDGDMIKRVINSQSTI